jgi:hypothetical protein
MAKVIGYVSSPLATDPIAMLELIDTNSQEDINIAGELVKKGFAVWSDNKRRNTDKESGSVPSRKAEPDLIIGSLTKDA